MKIYHETDRAGLAREHEGSTETVSLSIGLRRFLHGHLALGDRILMRMNGAIVFEAQLAMYCPRYTVFVTETELEHTLLSQVERLFAPCRNASKHDLMENVVLETVLRAIGVNDHDLLQNAVAVRTCLAPNIGADAAFERIVEHVLNRTESHTTACDAHSLSELWAA